ncbi:type III-B CRISPR module-associated protein Cmr5 [Saccharolobus caldissimus]|uniref:CRISPR type III-B/RAMP module-associated protein Cmr5 n=1 Tax=Saccharolobus caldissimus TaxID=1702097 RepID=A0AAQ4CVQ1_9CREN|nr:type III-B CRISPR module-associated protein Cmr5 [Saccharolobus caldissimus]BDB99882.1 type III-B CRISPR module-associated protein Cmr5 [Saccharolobus caldissimus]
MSYDDYKLAIEAFNKALNSLKGDARSKFRSRARDMVEEIYTSGFIPTFFYIISKAGLETNDKIDKLVTLLDSPASASINLGSGEEASYMAYLFVILYYLTERNIVDKKFLIDKLRCNRIELIDKLYELSPIISARIKRYLMAIKRLAEAVIEGR